MPYLIGNPETGKVEFRSLKRPMLSSTLGLEVLQVSKNAWELYRAGDEIQARDLPGELSQRWRRAVGRAARRANLG